MRTAVVIPLLASAIIWHERPAPLELIGSVVALLALSLVLSEVAARRTSVADNTTAKACPARSYGGEATRTAPQDEIPRQARNDRAARGAERDAKTEPNSALIAHRSSLVGSSALLWLVLLFIADDLVMIPALVFRKELPLTETMPFQTVIFVSAFSVTTLLYYLRRPRLEPEILKWGALLGTANFGNYLFLVLALSVLPGLVVYPVIAAGEVGLLAIAGVVLWEETVGVRCWLGIALSVVAIVLIQLGKAAQT